MKKTSLQFLKACSLSVALLGSVAIVATVSMPDVAFAKSGNDNGGGNGGGNGNGGNSDKSGGSSKADKADKAGKSDKSGKSDKADKKKSGGDSAKSKTKEKAKAKAKAKPKKKDLAGELGVHPSELGALNAAHANENALKNASPNSRVGRIAAYRDSVLAGEALADELALKEAELAGLDLPSRGADLIKTDLDLAVEESGTAAGNVTALETQLANTDPADTVAIDAINAQLVTARETLTAAELAEAGLQAEYDNAVAYEAVDAEIDELTQKIEDQPALERSLLEAAANKEVTDEVEAAVKKLLGL
ncbi:hypothetical protein [Tabrizicola sp.]|uniref:hypothetical protein n=1 Tax=Tabrizicola sp. TaxID=2005166 RepID=UPI0027373179|nr:hypothetical protein [Tabrizicola sp.]MDP3197966.1 hypothetical protein [Tabrizicola sp.]